MASYRYSPSSSPWSRRTLIVLWSTQLLYTILTTIVSLAIVGGIPALLTTVITIFCGCVTLSQIMLFSRNTLQPSVMLAMSCFQTLPWLLLTVLSLTWIIWGENNKMPLDHADIMEIIADLTVIPSGAQLLYASVVLQKFRNTARIAKLVDGVDMGKPQRLAGEELAIGNGEIK